MHFNIKALALTSSVIWGGALLFVGLANLVWADYWPSFSEPHGIGVSRLRCGGLNRASDADDCLWTRGRGGRGTHLRMALQSLGRRGPCRDPLRTKWS